MPMKLEKLEYSIYRLHVFGQTNYDEILPMLEEANAHKESAGERHQIYIIDRDPDAEVDISFQQIRQLSSLQDIRKIHYLHIDTGTAMRLAVSAVNRISPLNIEMVPNMETARILARDILSRYTQPRRPKKD